MTGLNMSNAEYAAIDAINFSRLKALRISPKHFKYQASKPWNDDDTPALRVGRAAHCFILDPDEFARQFVCYGKRRAGKKWEAFEAAHSSQTILNETEYYRALNIANAAGGHPLAREYLGPGLKEAVFTWKDKVTGTMCKGRIDHAGTHLVDVKTCAQVEPRLFLNQSARLGYHAQIAFYYDGIRANGVRVAPEPVIIAVESVEPHDVVVYAVPDHVLEAGRDEYRRLLALLEHCRKTDEWPGIAPDALSLDLPAWADDSGPLGLTFDGAGAGL